jgi:hypothetical protein
LCKIDKVVQLNSLLDLSSLIDLVSSVSSPQLTVATETDINESVTVPSANKPTMFNVDTENSQQSEVATQQPSSSSKTSRVDVDSVQTADKSIQPEMAKAQHND